MVLIVNRRYRRPNLLLTYLFRSSTAVCWTSWRRSWKSRMTKVPMMKDRKWLPGSEWASLTVHRYDVYKEHSGLEPESQEKVNKTCAFSLTTSRCVSCKLLQNDFFFFLYIFFIYLLDDVRYIWCADCKQRNVADCTDMDIIINSFVLIYIIPKKCVLWEREKKKIQIVRKKENKTWLFPYFCVWELFNREIHYFLVYILNT